MAHARAIAITAPLENPLVLVVESFSNFCSLAFDAMYGTPARSRRTMVAAAFLGVAGALMSPSDPGMFYNCAVPL